MVKKNNSKAVSCLKSAHYIFQELIENSVLPKPKKMSAYDHEALTKLLVEKDKQLKHTMVVSRLRRFCAQIYSYLLTHHTFFSTSWQ